MRHRLVLALGVMLSGGSSIVAGLPGVEQTRHNLSVSGPGTVKSRSETEICKFCHIPHTAVAGTPMWGHELSRIAQYATPQVASRQEPAPQPDGSSRLCLSCHDGTVALGELAGRHRRIDVGGVRLGKTFGSDLTGSHPVSFSVASIANDSVPRTSDMGVRPLALIEADRDVRLDRDGKMQCTTCHDPHVDRYYRPGIVPHFSVKPTITEICLVCHELR